MLVTQNDNLTKIGDTPVLSTATVTIPPEVMLKTTYDINLNGVVDDSEKLGGELPAYYTVQQDFIDHVSDVSLHIPTGGISGQVLVKTGIGDTDLDWDNRVKTIIGSVGQVEVSNIGDTYQLNLPQDIATTSEPLFRKVQVREFATIGDELVPYQQLINAISDNNIKPSANAYLDDPLIMLSGEQTIDGVALVDGNMVLRNVPELDSTSPSNGLWIVRTGAWEREPRMDAWSEVPYAVSIITGGTHVGERYIQTNVTPTGTIDVNPIIWTELASGGSIAEAPVDGKTYGRYNSGWNEVAPRSWTDSFSMLHSNGITGGGLLSSKSYAISWGTRFILISMAKNVNIPSGYFDINMPPNGTVINSLNGGAPLTVANGRIPLPGWGVLWYKLPITGGNATNNANFFYSVYTGGTFDVPADYLLVAAINGDDATVRFCDGTTIPNRSDDIAFDNYGNSPWVQVPSTGWNGGGLVHHAIYNRLVRFGSAVEIRGGWSVDLYVPIVGPNGMIFGTVAPEYRPVNYSYYNNGHPGAGGVGNIGGYSDADYGTFRWTVSRDTGLLKAWSPDTTDANAWEASFDGTWSR